MNANQINLQITGYDSENEVPEQARTIYNCKQYNFNIRKYNNNYYIVFNQEGNGALEAYTNQNIQKPNFINDVMQISKNIINQSLQINPNTALNINRAIITSHGDKTENFWLTPTYGIHLNQILTQLKGDNANNENYIRNTSFIMATACHVGKDLTQKELSYRYKTSTTRSNSIINTLKNTDTQLLIVGGKNINYNTDIKVLNKLLDNNTAIEHGLNQLIKTTPCSMHLFSSSSLHKFKCFKLFQTNEKNNKFLQLSKPDKAKYIITKIRKHIQNRNHHIINNITHKNPSTNEISNTEILKYISQELVYFNTKQDKSFLNSPANEHIKFILENENFIINELQTNPKHIQLKKEEYSVKYNNTILHTHELQEIYNIFKYCAEKKIHIDAIPYIHLNPKAHFLIKNIDELQKKYKLQNINNNLSSTYNQWETIMSKANICIKSTPTNIELRKFNKIIKLLPDIYRKLDTINELNNHDNEYNKENRIHSTNIQILQQQINNTFYPDSTNIPDLGLNSTDLFNILHNKYDIVGNKRDDQTPKQLIIQTPQQAQQVRQYLINKDIINLVNTNFNHNGRLLNNHEINSPPITNINTALNIIKSLKEKNLHQKIIHPIQHLLVSPDDIIKIKPIAKPIRTMNRNQNIYMPHSIKDIKEFYDNTTDIKTTSLHNAISQSHDINNQSTINYLKSIRKQLPNINQVLQKIEAKRSLHVNQTIKTPSKRNPEKTYQQLSANENKSIFRQIRSQLNNMNRQLSQMKAKFANKTNKIANKTNKIANKTKQIGRTPF